IVLTKRDTTQLRRTYLYHLERLSPMTKYEAKMNLTYRPPPGFENEEGAKLFVFPIMFQYLIFVFIVHTYNMLVLHMCIHAYTYTCTCTYLYINNFDIHNSILCALVI